MYGSHLSIAGSMHKAILHAESLGMETVQVFTKNQQQWQAKPLDPAAVADWKRELARMAFQHVVAHDSYLINLAAANDALREKSIAAFSAELQRCDDLDIPYLVTHPGAHTGQGEEAGIAKVIAAYKQILAGHPNGRVTICVETTAGQGTCLGHRFEHIAAILRGVGNAARMGVCVDTCHILAAGYDITTAEGTRAVLAEFDRIVGLKHLRVFHLNDSKKALGTRVDRHEHIGLGHVGPAAFGVICADPRFAGIPKILETAKETAPDGRDWDVVNLESLKRLAAGKRIKPMRIAGQPAAKAGIPNTRRGNS